jgi:hypothetical protein
VGRKNGWVIVVFKIYEPRLEPDFSRYLFVEVLGQEAPEGSCAE